MESPDQSAPPWLAATPSSGVTRPPMDYPTTYWPDTDWPEMDLTAPPAAQNLQPGWDR